MPTGPTHPSYNSYLFDHHFSHFQFILCTGLWTIYLKNSFYHVIITAFSCLWNKTPVQEFKPFDILERGSKTTTFSTICPQKLNPLFQRDGSNPVQMTKKLSGFVLPTVHCWANHRRTHKAAYCLPNINRDGEVWSSIPQTAKCFIPVFHTCATSWEEEILYIYCMLSGGKTCHTRSTESSPSHWDWSSSLYCTYVVPLQSSSVKISSVFAFSKVTQFFDSINTSDHTSLQANDHTNHYL